MKILLHLCCGPCAAFPVQHLREAGHEIVGYFFNPNIHPYKEFTRRLETSREFAAKVGLDLVVDAAYTLEDYLVRALAAGDDRCRACYGLRLEKAARYAGDHGFDCFTTTLLVSPYQRHEIIKEVGESAAASENVPFCYIDFRPGWTEGVRISKELELYRQPYCGCIFSERDRYYKPRKEDRLQCPQASTPSAKP
ncbi:MAG: epoxyqueuosine reductase QueH [Sporomusaceae bacterium]|nr:epoxyqueuosine reductase QueH [Sporomusaceae bacterium]